MPKAKKDHSVGNGPYAGPVTHHLPPPLQYTSFQPLLGINGKNVASSFGKNDVQLWWTRRADDELWEEQRGWKKGLMMGDETVALASRPAQEPRAVNGIRRHDPKGKDKAVSDDGESAQADEDPASRIIIIHPGARTTRIGRASDPNPVSVPTVVARKCSDASRRGFRTDSEPSRDPEAREAYDGKIGALRADLRARMRTLKLRGTTNGQALAASFNAEVVPEALNEAQDPFQGQWTRPAGEDTIVGQAALSLANPAADGYTVRWPLKGGTFNTSAAAGYVSKSELLADVEALWLHAVTVHLGIPEMALKDYSAMLVIPDSYEHVYVREMSDLLFRSLGFKQVLLQQEALCVCFGAGLGTACVIDVGASKTSVTCVEEGSILPDTRMRLAFGGDDVSVVLTEMLRRQNLPCRIDLDAPWDFATMDDVKEQISVLSEGDVGLNIYSAYKRDPAAARVKFELRVYDEVIVAPMALFAPRIIDFDRKLNPGPVLYSSTAELDDVLDLGGNAVTEAMRSCTAHLHPQSSAAAAEAGAELVPPEPAADDLSASVPASPTAGDAAAAPLSTVQTRLPSPEAAAPLEVRAEASKIPLHVAVAESILAVGSEERAKRLLGAIMVVGGGGLIHNVGYAIASRVQPLVAAKWPSIGDAVIVPPPREFDARELAWKGVGLISRLDVVNDLWIRASDFDTLGYKALRERLLLY